MSNDNTSLQTKARIIRERRTIMATTKNMMGPSGKLGSIAKWLGDPVIRQGTGLFDQTYLPDMIDEEDDGGVPIIDNSFIQEEGWHFDGLSRGIHLEILYLSGINKLTAYSKGFLVYEELRGDLYAYAPAPEWEDKIEMLYKQAKKRAEDMGFAIREAKEASKAERVMTFLTDLRARWGI